MALVLGMFVFPVQSAGAQQPLDAVALTAVPPVDLAAVRAEDEERDRMGLAPRFAVARHTMITPQTDGTWEDLDAETRLWRLRISSPGALSLNLAFTTYFMPAGGQLLVYAADGSHSLRPFTEGDNEAHGELWTPVVLSDEIVVEVTVPRGVEDQLVLVLTSINVGYRGFGELLGEKSGSCNRDVVCPEGYDWRNEIQSVGVISTGGSLFCTGFMVNNTAQDRTPYFMIANHCEIDLSNAASLVVYWNYQASTCGGPRDGRLDQSQTGSYFRSTYTASDFTLVLLDDDPEPEFGVAFAGWDRSTSAPSSAVAIHHPSCDEKAISFENDPTMVTSYYGTTSPGDGTHIRVIDWDLGTTEPGSSGSPLFDPNHRVVGQLHGGDAACGNDESDWYGRFYTSWTGGGTSSTRLSNWLDPGHTGIQIVDTIPPACHITFTPTEPETDETVTFHCEATDPGGTITSYAWTFGDGGTSPDATPTHAYATGDTFRVTLTITTSGGATAGCSTSVWVSGDGDCLDYTVDDTVEYHWEDITTGVPLGLGDDDAAYFDTPFPFEFCGAPVSQVVVYANGAVWFDDLIIALGFDNECLPHDPDTGVTQFILPWWDDLNPGAGGGVYIDVLGTAPNRRLIIEWYNVPHYQAIGAITFEVILYEGGDRKNCILMQYADTVFGDPSLDHGASATIGVQCSTTCAYEYSCNSAAVFNGDAILFCPPEKLPPECSITYSPSKPTTADVITLNANANDPDGTVVAWEWDFGDGHTGTGDPATHQYGDVGTYTVTCTVTDNDGLEGECSVDITVWLKVEIPLTEIGWHMIAVPLEPVNKTVLVDRGTMEIDPESIFYSSYVAGNDPVNRLFRTEPGVGYWTYNPELDPFHKWYEIGVAPPDPWPHPGPWWQGFWFLIDVPHTLTYTAYPLPAGEQVRFLDITTSPMDWAWMMMGACARIPDPYDPDVTTWPTTSTVHDMMWGVSTPPTESTTWIPTSDCDLPDAWDSGYIGLPLCGYITGTAYYTVSPSQVVYCGPPATITIDSLTPGEGYWLDTEDLEAWLKLYANQWP